MKKIIDYTVLEGRSMPEISTLVKRNIEIGWFPTGGIAIIKEGENLRNVFFQAMIKYEI